MPHIERISDTYQTTILPPGPISGALLRTRLCYVSRFLGILFTHWRIAKKGAFTQQAWHDAAWQVIRVLETSGGRFDIKGLSNMTQVQEPVVFVSNHMSTLETLIFPALTYPRKQIAFILKRSLLYIPFFKEFIKDCVAVTRKNPTEDFKTVMTQGVAVLNNGFSVIVFPQATRYKAVDTKSFNSLGIKLARKAGVPVIPVALKTDFWSSGLILRDFGRLHPEKTIFFEFGEPFTVSGSGRQEHERVLEFISSRLTAWQGR